MGKKIEVYSFSKLSTFMQCARKYFWSYVMKLEPLTRPEYFAIGSSVHSGAAGEEVEEDEKDKWYQIGKMAAEYFGRYPDQQEEVEGSIKISKTVIITGIADALTKDLVIERKTTGRANEHTCNSMAISLQNRMYGKMFQKDFGELHIIKKPSIRIRKHEMPHGFDERVLQEYRNAPENMFAKIKIDLDTSNVTEELLQVVRGIRSCKRNKMWPGGSPYVCYSMLPCPFLKLCQSEENMIMFKKKTRKEVKEKGAE